MQVSTIRLRNAINGTRWREKSPIHKPSMGVVVNGEAGSVTVGNTVVVVVAVMVAR